ncbi:unnamed protein product [Acanthocheilonema viteae]|uniref:Reelin domain-containing protein n=1 Tax=Acanthocheilonema viteae TaxID=6277 RepID=A0A498SH70_ACAVI|nr:unnamed protein product [Acanthocheilonema viteae]
MVISWPDGAPCLHAVFESMNPLEAVEHQGGLQRIIVVNLKGNTSTDRFRGFAIQPISYRGPNRGKRVGQFLRLDDNGSWQQQCFRFKNSVTHSHDEKKKHIKLWWKNELNDDDYVQFVATVVKAQKEFWVKSVKSIPIPPCRIEKSGIEEYIPDPITPPPPANKFKLDTFKMFDALDNDLQWNLLLLVPNDADNTPKPQRIQDFFKVVQISNRLNANLTSPLIPSTRVTVVRPSVSPLISVSQTRPTSVQNLSPTSQSNIAQPISSIAALSRRQQPSPLTSNSIPFIPTRNNRVRLAKQQSLQRIFKILPNNRFQRNFNRTMAVPFQRQPFPPSPPARSFQQDIPRNRVNSRIRTSGKLLYCEFTIGI